MARPTPRSNGTGYLAAALVGVGIFSAGILTVLRLRPYILGLVRDALGGPPPARELPEIYRAPHGRNGHGRERPRAVATMRRAPIA